MHLKHLHTPTLSRKLRLAGGKSIWTQWADNVERCVERAGQTLTDNVHSLQRGREEK